MPKEPEIVKILREEERLGKIQTKSTVHIESPEEKIEPSSVETSSETLMMVQPVSEHHLNDMNNEDIHTIYKTIFETTAVAILIIDTKGYIISWNSFAERFLGKTHLELQQRSIATLYPTTEWLNINSLLAKQPKRWQYFETKMYTKDNKQVDVAVSLCILRNNKGKNLGSVQIFKDISAQKQAEHRLNSIMEYADDSVYLLDSQQRYIMVNNALLSRLNITREEVVGKTFADFHCLDETNEFTQKFSWVFEHGQPVQDEHCKNGTWFLRTLSPVKDLVTGSTTAILVVSKNITENKKAEEQLMEKEKKYRTMFEFFPQTIILIDKHGTILDANERIEQWLNYKPQEIIGKNLFTLEVFTQDTSTILKKNFSSKISHITIPAFEVEVRTKNSEKRISVVHATSLQDEKKQITATLIVFTDVTEQKHMEAVLRIKDNAINSSINAIALADLEGNLTYVNKSFLHMWGYSKEKCIIGKPMVQYWKTNTKKFEVMDVLRKKGEWIGELTGIRKDNSRFQMQLSANVIKDESSKPVCIICFFIDITKYNKAVKALSESEKKFRVVLENSLDIIYQLNMKNQTCDYVSPSSLKVMGYTSEEMTSFTFKQLRETIHPADRTRQIEHVKLITNYGKRREIIEPIEYRIKHKEHGYRWVSDTCSAIFDEKHEPIALVGTIEDITDRKKVWDELVKSEEKYRILAETSADGVFTTDALGRLTYVNPSFEKLCGRRKSQILATPFRNYLLEDSIYFFQQIFIDVRKKNEKIENVELELVDGNGSITPIEVNIAPLKKEAEFNGVVCTVRDITQRREIEDELKKNERLKTEFMNIAAHELRSPVTPIKGYLDLIIHDNESNEKIKNWAKISLRNAERLLKLVNDILDVARLDSDTMRFEMEKIAPVELLNEIVEDMRPAITNKKLEFRINTPDTLPYLIGDKNRLSQVLKNLIGNALKFTDQGFIALEAEIKDNRLLIAVVDTGIGISKDELKKIFTKFYQAYTGEDRNNEGTGLGLFISKEIVKKHKGTIWAESEVGKGSRFVIQLPYIHKMIVDFKT